MEREPGVLSSTSTLRKLAQTSAFYDLSGGECRPLELGRIGVGQSRHVGASFDGDRARATQQSIRRLARLLETSAARTLPPAEQRAWRMLAPILTRIPDLARWTASERKRLLRILRAKGGASEIGVDSLIRSHARLRRALQAL